MASRQVDLLECPECREDTQILIDDRQGVVICRSCGLVLQNETIDESQEWRSFSDGAEKNDRNRVGGVGNEFLHNQASGTSIGFGNTSLQRSQMMVGSADSVDRALMKGHSILRDIMLALALPDNVFFRCCEIIKHLDLAGHLKNKVNYAWMLAVVYMACRQEKAGRTIKDLVAADPTTKDKDIARNYWKLDKLLADSSIREGAQSQGADSFMARYGSRLGLVQCESVAEHIAMEASRFNMTGSRNPAIVAAAAIYLVAHATDCKSKPTIESLADVTQLKIHALRNCYLTLRQHVARFIPTDFKPAIPLAQLPL